MTNVFCSNCGTQLPSEANFCWKCGKTLKSDSKVNDPEKETKWDTCEIVYYVVRETHIFSGDILKFWANAIGSKGKYNAGESKEFKGEVHGLQNCPESDSAKANSALALLIKDLVKKGWESTGDRGEAWYNHRFRRRVQ